MDELLLKQTIKQLLEKIKGVENNDYQREATQKLTNPDDLKRIAEEVKLQEECTKLVIKALDNLQDKNYPEVDIPVEQLSTIEVKCKNQEADGSDVFSALLKDKLTNNEQLSTYPDIIQVPDKEPVGPVFIQYPQNISLKKGEKAEFNCEISGSKPMTVQWNFNGEPLDHESNRYIFRSNDKEFSLEIPVLLATDQGQYAVIASNAKGKIIATFSLHVDQS